MGPYSRILENLLRTIRTSIGFDLNYLEVYNNYNRICFRFINCQRFFTEKSRKIQEIVPRIIIKSIKQGLISRITVKSIKLKSSFTVTQAEIT